MNAAICLYTMSENKKVDSLIYEFHLFRPIFNFTNIINMQYITRKIMLENLYINKSDKNKQYN